MRPKLKLQTRRALWRGWMRLRRGLGDAGVWGIALLVLAAALATWLPHLKQETTGLAAALQKQSLLAANSAANVSTLGPRASSDADLMRNTLASFPQLARNQADLDAIFTAAARRNVTLLKGEYQLKLDPGSPLAAYTATFPIRGDYATLKDFSGDVLRALPHVSLDEFRVSRDAAGSTSLEAVVRFTLFYRN